MSTVQGQAVTNDQSQNAELTAPYNCGTKSFYCVDENRFLLCFDVNKNGQKITVSNNYQSCQAGTYCDNNGEFQCESAYPVTEAQTASTANPTGEFHYFSTVQY